MGMLVSAVLLFFTLGTLLLFGLFHLIFGLPVWLLIGGVALYFVLRKGARQNRYLGQGRPYYRYIDRHSRW